MLNLILIIVFILIRNKITFFSKKENKQILKKAKRIKRLQKKEELKTSTSYSLIIVIISLIISLLLAIPAWEEILPADSSKMAGSILLLFYFGLVAITTALYFIFIQFGFMLLGSIYKNVFKVK